MPDALSPEKDGVEKVAVSGAPAIERLARVKEEGDVETLGVAGGTEGEQFGGEVMERESWFFAADEVVATDQVWEFLFQFNTLHQRSSDAFLAEGAGTAVDYF